MDLKTPFVAPVPILGLVEVMCEEQQEKETKLIAPVPRTLPLFLLTRTLTFLCLNPPSVQVGHLLCDRMLTKKQPLWLLLRVPKILPGLYAQGQQPFVVNT